MKRFLVPLALTATLLSPAAAQANQPSLGLGLGIVKPEDIDATLWSTINFRLPIGRRLYVEPEVGFWKKSEGSGGTKASLQDLNLGGNLILDLGGRELSFWVGAGLGAHLLKAKVKVGDAEISSDTNTELGVHLLGGLDYNLDRDLDLFAAARLDIVNQEGTDDNFNEAKFYGGLRVRF